MLLTTNCEGYAARYGNLPTRVTTDRGDGAFFALQHLRGEIQYMNELFHKFAYATAEVVGSPLAFIVGLIILIVWALSGPFFGFSDTWQLVVNTGTTIVTFLVVFLIQSAQNRDARAIHLKLDELLRAMESARTSLVDLEHRSDADLEQLQAEFHHLRKLQGKALEPCPEPEEIQKHHKSEGERRLRS